MSGEVLEGSHLLVNTDYGDEELDFAHHAVHDIESFFWVLLYICLTRKGPGGARRDELNHNEAPDEATKQLWHVIYCLFDSAPDTLSQNKRVLFTQKKLLDKVILPAVHPYFGDLHDLIKKWYELLQQAHKFHFIERDTIHDQTLKLIEGTIAELEEKERLLPKDTPEHELTIQERERRRKEIYRIRETFLVSPSTPPQTYQIPIYNGTPEGIRGEPGAKLDIMKHTQPPDSPLAKKSKRG